MDYSKLDKITVKTQEELDAIPDDFKGKIHIQSRMSKRIDIKKRYETPVEVRGKSWVAAWGEAEVHAWSNTRVEARDNSTVSAVGNSYVVARESSTVFADENAHVEALDNSFIEAWGNSNVKARGNSHVLAVDCVHIIAYGNSCIEALGSSYVEAFCNSYVVAWGRSEITVKGNVCVTALGNSHVVADDNSHVVARENSRVDANGNAHVKAYGNSYVAAWEEVYVEAYGNSQVSDNFGGAKIKASGNSRIVHDPRNIYEFMDFYGIRHTDTSAIFYIVVKKSDGKYFSEFDGQHEYIYEIGKSYCDGIGKGLPITCLDMALSLQIGHDLALLEVETLIANIIYPKDLEEDVRTRRLKVIREVPHEECGAFGKIHI